MRRPKVFILCALWLFSAVVSGALEGPLELADRIVAVVDEDAILLSDIEQVIGLGLVEAEPEESEEALRRRVLDGLIDQKLRFHEIDRFGFTEAPAAEVERAFEAFRAGFASRAELQRRLAELGLDDASLRRLFARQLMVLTYVDERLGARVFVSLEDIQSYYASELVPRLEAAGEPIPPLAEVREQIRGVIKEERLNREIDRWTEELRAEADVVDYLDAEASALPPVVVSSDGSE